ncbi:MAG: hypothetical protein IH607_07265 [Firmicutes bacterium]|nr:hypothetical protein [Bacillota bacterium]
MLRHRQAQQLHNPDTALPPGEAFSDIDRIDNWSSFQYKATLEARANPGWIFLGWEFDDSFYEKHEKPYVYVIDAPESKIWRTHSFELFDTVTAKAVFTYVGPGSLYYEYARMNPVIVTSEDGETTYNVGVYERDPVSVDGDYGTLFCYPYDFSNDMNIPAGEIILLAALPRDGFQFDCWRVFEEEKKGFDQPQSEVLIFTVAAPFSIDTIFKPVIVR